MFEATGEHCRESDADNEALSHPVAELGRGPAPSTWPTLGYSSERSFGQCVSVCTASTGGPT